MDDTLEEGCVKMIVKPFKTNPGARLSGQLRTTPKGVFQPLIFSPARAMVQCAAAAISLMRHLVHNLNGKPVFTRKN